MCRWRGHSKCYLSAWHVWKKDAKRYVVLWVELYRSTGESRSGLKRAHSNFWGPEKPGSLHSSPLGRHIILFQGQKLSKKQPHWEYDGIKWHWHTEEETWWCRAWFAFRDNSKSFRAKCGTVFKQVVFVTKTKYYWLKELTFLSIPYSKSAGIIWKLNKTSQTKNLGKL